MQEVLEGLARDAGWQEELTMALKAYNKVSEEERAWAYHLSMDRAEADYNNGLRLAAKKAKEEQATAIVRRMFASGKYSVEDVAEVTGLSIENVQRLQNA